MSKIVKRTIDVFELFGRAGEPLSLSEVARRLDLPVSSSHDVLHSLAERGYLYQPGPRGEYYPTLRLAVQAEAIARNDPFLLRARIEIRALAERYAYSFSLARREGCEARYVLVHEGQGPWRHHVETGALVRALHATSPGKALLGSLPPDEAARVIAGLDFAPMTAHTLRDAGALLADIEASRARGWYANHEESVPTASTLAVPLRWARAVYFLGLAGPAREIRPRDQALAADLIAAARRLEAPR